jgi:hypothetical protein
MIGFGAKEQFLYRRAAPRYSQQVLLGIGLAFGACFYSQTGLPFQNKSQERSQMSQYAQGPFNVNLTAQKPDSEVAKAANLGRMAIDKQFHGELEAISKGEMLAAQTEVKGSAGYVAMERVTGTLDGRKGSFLLQHSATMSRGVPDLTVIVVPDSGTDELRGLQGKMNIIIAPDGKHSYAFDYTLD